MLDRIGDMPDNFFDLESASYLTHDVFAKDRRYDTGSQTAHYSSFMTTSSVMTKQPLEIQFQRFSQNFKYINFFQMNISLKDLLLPIMGKKKAFVYHIDLRQDFLKQITRHEDKLVCQLLYY